MQYLASENRISEDGGIFRNNSDNFSIFISTFSAYVWYNKVNIYKQAMRSNGNESVGVDHCTRIQCAAVSG